MNKKVQVEFTDAFCARHGEPFRATFPKGVYVAVPMLVNAFSDLEKVDKYAEGDAERFETAVREMGPMCCAISEKALLSIYWRAEIGRLGICERCSKGRLGTPYRVRGSEGVMLVRHLCFECVVRQAKLKP